MELKKDRYTKQNSFSIIFLFLIGILFYSCTEKNKEQPNTESFKNKGHELIHAMVHKVGTYQDLLEKKDVVYTYTYTTPKGQVDVSTEKYIFDGELSYGLYATHERTLAQLEGPIEQGYDGSEYWIKHKGEVLDKEEYLKRVAFSRPTNFYWFAMFQKLLDPGLKYEHLGEMITDDKEYDVVKVSFSDDTKPTDIYQVYINKETQLVDQFLFTVADFSVFDTPRLMKLEYQTVDGIIIPAKRKYKKSTWTADVNEDPWINVSWTNIKFNNGLSRVDFKK